MFDHDQHLHLKLEGLRAAQDPVAPGMPRHPSRKNAYFRALAEAFEAGNLLPVKAAGDTHET